MSNQKFKLNKNYTFLMVWFIIIKLLKRTENNYNLSVDSDHKKFIIYIHSKLFMAHFIRDKICYAVSLKKLDE